MVTGTAHLVRDPAEVNCYQRTLRPWVIGDMDQVLRIRPQIVTGSRLDDEAGIGNPSAPGQTGAA